MPDKTDANETVTLTAATWRTGGDHWDVGEDYPSGPEIQYNDPEWSNWRGSE